MRLYDLFKRFAISYIDSEGVEQMCNIYEDTADGSVMVGVEDGSEDQFTFDADTPVTFAGMTFAATDRFGGEHSFGAYEMRRINFDTEKL